MTTPSIVPDDPFVDPAPATEGHGSDQAFAVDSTLAVGRNASLTLGTDSLIVLGMQRAPHISHVVILIDRADEAFQNKNSNCCGLWPSSMSYLTHLLQAL